MPSFSLLVLVLFVLGGLAAPADPPASVREEMLEALNAVRSRGGVCGRKPMAAAPALLWNRRLEQAAARHARDMAANGHFDHKGTDGTRAGDRAHRAGYKWRIVGENIAWRQTSVEEVVEDWLESPSHCRQIFDPRFKEVGAARSGAYWAQVFGARR